MSPSFARRTAKAAVFVAAIVAIGGGQAPARAQDELPARLVADLHGAFGVHHARAVHAKGIILTGHFDPTPGAAVISRADVFRHPMPVIVRFSDFTGLPAIPDTDGNASPRGMAIKFGTVDDAALDIVAHSFDGFPVSTAADFGRLFEAIAASGPGTPAPTPLDRFLAAHPVAKTFLTSQRSPESFAMAAYFGVNAFHFTDRAGRQLAVRYRFVPVAGEHYFDAATLRSQSPDYLMRDIAKRIARGPVRFDWYAQVATAGDDIRDPAVAWPATRLLIRLGTITIDHIAADQNGLDRRLVFLPGNVPAGIAAADPMVAVRTAAYPISFGERQ